MINVGSSITEKVWNRWPVHNLSVIVSYYYPNMSLSIVRNMQNSGPKFAPIPINYIGVYIIRDQNQIAVHIHSFTQNLWSNNYHLHSGFI